MYYILVLHDLETERPIVCSVDHYKNSDGSVNYYVLGTYEECERKRIELQSIYSLERYEIMQVTPIKDDANPVPPPPSHPSTED